MLYFHRKFYFHFYIKEVKQHGCNNKNFAGWSQFLSVHSLTKFNADIVSSEAGAASSQLLRGTRNAVIKLKVLACPATLTGSISWGEYMFKSSHSGNFQLKIQSDWLARNAPLKTLQQ